MFQALLLALLTGFLNSILAQPSDLAEKVGQLITEINKVQTIKDGERAPAYQQAVTAMDSIWASSGALYDNIVASEGDIIDSLYKNISVAINSIDHENIDRGIASFVSLKAMLERLASLLNIPVLIDFTGQACKACKVMKGRLENINRSFGDRVRIVYILVNEQKDLTKKYKIMLIPTLVLIDTDGREIWRSVGEIEEPKLINKLEEYLRAE